MIKYKIAILSILTLLLGCNKAEKTTTGKLSVVTTTTMITDMIKIIGGDRIDVQGLMGSGVDPHLYKASEGDVSKLSKADVIFYNGLHLEGKLEDIFEKMHHQNIKTVALAKVISKDQLITSENFSSNYDPHIWFHIDYWISCVKYAATELSKVDPPNKSFYATNSENYIIKLEQLKKNNNLLVANLPLAKRVLITAHDAFNYFGKAYNFEVIGLQGLSTATEAGVQDVQNLANLIIEKKVKAIFVESSVPKRTIQALQASVKAKGHNVEIGGELFSDALGSKGTAEENYIGMYKHNISTIVKSLQ